MEPLRFKKVNPFAVTQAIDLTDEEIQRLWVDIGHGDAETLFNPTSPMPLFLLGGKGSGKTHLMRYHSFALQRLRYDSDEISVADGLARDGYIGVYTLLSSLNAERFSGRGQSQDVWDALFGYYLELWVAQELLQILVSLCSDLPPVSESEQDVCAAIVSLIGTPEANLTTFSNLLDWLAKLQAEIDRAINNVVFENKLDILIRVTPGQLIFGIPKALRRKISSLRKVVFAFQLDEFELLSKFQQQHVNTLIRQRSIPSTFRIGGRLWSIRTRETRSGEENKEGSEFDVWYIDRRFRQSKAQWINFAYRLVMRRLEVAGPATTGKLKRSQVDELFESPDLSWDSDFLRQRMKSRRTDNAGYISRFKTKLAEGVRAGAAPGLSSDSAVRTVIRKLEVAEYPLLEKVNILLFHQAWYRGENLAQRADQIEAECKRFRAKPRRATKYQRAVQHYGSDMLAQLFRDERKHQSLHYGMKSFVRMSEGLPRSLLTLLKQIFGWAIYNSSTNEIHQISTRDQDLGISDSADWFLTTMRKSGEHERAILTGIERLGRLFETNRFSDKPIECSLLGFSVRERDLHPLTQERLRLAEQHSFLIRIARGEIDRNTRERVSKFQINAILGPRWNLPAARRGIARLKPAEIELIFDPSREADFSIMHRRWQDRMTAPFFGKGTVDSNSPLLFELNP